MMQQNPSTRGITLIETCLSTIVVGGLLGASISAVGNLATAQQFSSDRARGHQLAEDILSEAQMLPYVDPTFTDDQIGPSAAELATGNRSLFNDADDYANFAEGPPANKDGSTIPGFDGWKRIVTVDWVDPSANYAVSPSTTGFKRITVIVAKHGRKVAELSCIKSAAWNKAVWLNGAASNNSVTVSRENDIGSDVVPDTTTGDTLIGSVTGLVGGVLDGLLG